MHKIIFFLSLTAALQAQTLTPAGRELEALQQQRDKAAAAAMTPIDARFKALLKPLLTKATQQGDFKTAQKITALLRGESLSDDTSPAANANPSSSSVSPQDKLPATAIKEIEKRFEGTMWEMPGDARYWTEFFFAKDGTMTRLTGPRTDQTASFGEWKMLDTGVVQGTGIGGKTFWFTFDSSTSGTVSEVTFSKDGQPLKNNKALTQLEPGKRLPKLTNKR